MKSNGPCLVWFRKDLRVSDNPALREAVRRGRPALPVFIWAPEEENDWAPGAASRWWLHHSLLALDKDLKCLGSRLLIRRGKSDRELLRLAHETGATAVFWNRRYEPAAIKSGQNVEAQLSLSGLATETFNSHLLYPPWRVQNKSGRPFLVFTAFWRACQTLEEPPKPLAAPAHIRAPRRWPASLQLADLNLLRPAERTRGLQASWSPGEQGAANRLNWFLSEAFAHYGERRDRPDLAGTSRLSPHLAFGEISPRQVWHRLREFAGANSVAEKDWRGSQFVTELGWREFAYHLLYHFPHTPARPLRAEFENFRWRRQAGWLKAWQSGRTGYPLIDAGMRQLSSTGWMHNRVRMLAASFLVKDLLLPWQEGARWFWKNLVDADLANNTLGWQWTAGCGADAAPFFRIFNPVTQGQKFDPEGDYVRAWIPELERLPRKWLHQPFAAPGPVLAEAGVELGKNYPKPLVPHHVAREVALEAYARIRTGLAK